MDAQTGGAVELALDGPFLRWGGKLIVLSPVQMGLMEVFMRHPNEPLSVSALKCLSGGIDGSDVLVRNHVRRLRKKIGEPDGNPRLLRTVKGYGYMLVTDDKFGELLDRTHDGLGRLKR